MHWGHYTFVYNSDGQWVQFNDDTLTVVGDLGELLTNRYISPYLIVYTPGNE